MAWGTCWTPDFRAFSGTGGSGSGATTANRKLFESTSGTPTFVLDAIDTGRYAARFNNASATNLISAQMAASLRYTGGLFRFRVQSAFGTAVPICSVLALTTSADTMILRVGTTGLLGYSLNNGVSYTDTATQLVQGTVYRLEMFVDWNTGSTHTLKVRLDGVEVINTTGGTGSATSNVGFLIGSASSVAMTVDYADLVTYNDVAQYGLLTDWRVIGLEPTVDGTHSMTANDFQDTASANLTNASTGTFALVDDMPSAAPNVSDFVKQVVVRSTSYMEWQLRAMPSGYSAPILVSLAGAFHPVAGTTANASALRLVSGANAAADAAVDTSIASNTLEYRKNTYTTEPGGAAWTDAMVKAPLRARFGYNGTSISAPPALDAVMAFVAAPITLVSGTASGTSATSATAAGTATHHAYAGTATGTSATSGVAAGTEANHQYAGTATSTSATSATATGTAVHHVTSGTASATSPTSGTAAGAATHHAYAGTATSTSATDATAAGAAVHHAYAGAASGTSTTDASALGVDVRYGTATSSSATSAAATGTATHHAYAGTASATSPTNATATGTAVHHPYAGTASGTSATQDRVVILGSIASSGTDISVNTNSVVAQPFTITTPGTITALHLYAGGQPSTNVDVKLLVYSDTAGNPDALVGEAGPFHIGDSEAETWHVLTGLSIILPAAGTYYLGVAVSNTGSSAITGIWHSGGTLYLSTSATYASHASFGTFASAPTVELSIYADVQIASAVGIATHHAYTGTATGSAPTSGTAAGSATHHAYAGIATATSATSGAAAGAASDHQYAGTASATSATNATAAGAATPHAYTGAASGTSQTSATAAGTISGGGVIVTGRAGGEPWHYREVRYPRFGAAVATSTTWGRAQGTIRRGRRQREEDDFEIRLAGLVGSWP